MIIFQDLPYASERMGILWTLCTVADACILEFGPEGSTHYAAVQHGTYNAGMKACLYTTGLTEKEVIFGNPKRLKEAALELIRTHQPSHLFVVPSAVSEIIGMDIDSVCLALSRETRTQVIPIGGISLDTAYSSGVQRVLSLLAETVVQQPDSADINSYNIIGPGMDCYNYLADIKEVERLMAESFGLRPKAIFTADTSMKSLKSAGEAACNIVLRSEGIPCAKILEERFNQPYFYGAPYGYKGTLSWIESVAEMIKISPSQDFLKKEAIQVHELREQLDYHKRVTRSMEPSLLICGPHDLLKGLTPFIQNELTFKVKGSVLTHPKPKAVEGEGFFFKNDTEKYAFIATQKPDFLLADAVTLKHFKGLIPGLQVSNPNLGSVRRFAYTPFMGFRGAQVIAQELANLILSA